MSSRPIDPRRIGVKTLGEWQASPSRREACMADREFSPEETARRHEELARLATALAQLHDDQRVVLELKQLHGFTLVEICGQTGLSKPAVVGLLFEGVKALRVLLDDSRTGTPVERP
jgi:RNA polymerase sigma-70 factor (ECF subfamily)